MSLICFNGQILAAEVPVLTATNRGFKFGDGVFETMKVKKSTIQLEGHHFERLFTSLKLLLIDFPYSNKDLSNKIKELCASNKCLDLGRVRLAVYRNDKGRGDYLIEALPLPPEKVEWNERGWTIDIYPYAKKAPDAFSNLKSANYLPYVMADLYAKEKGLEETIVLNNSSHICDASKANIFLIKEGEISTPALHQGCINGVMRRYLIEELKKKGYVVQQEAISLVDLESADEVFLTNALQNIKWVQRFREKEYTSTLTRKLYSTLF